MNGVSLPNDLTIPSYFPNNSVTKGPFLYSMKQQWRSDNGDYENVALKPFVGPGLSDIVLSTYAGVISRTEQRPQTVLEDGFARCSHSTLQPLLNFLNCEG